MGISRHVTLPRSFFARASTDVAVALLGCVLVSDRPDGRVAVRLTETEAYDGPDDPGSHAYRGRTDRNAVMFGPPGHVYVYFTYGMHWCANLVCRGEGDASAVLVRAGEVVDGLELARGRRPSAKSDRDLARGPARLASALGITGGDNGAGAVEPDGVLSVHAGDPVPPEQVRSGPRVGVGGAGAATPWRFWLADEPTVSPYRAHSPRRRPAP